MVEFFGGDFLKWYEVFWWVQVNWLSDLIIWEILCIVLLLCIQVKSIDFNKGQYYFLKIVIIVCELLCF